MWGKQTLDLHRREHVWQPTLPVLGFCIDCGQLGTGSHDNGARLHLDVLRLLKEVDTIRRAGACAAAAPATCLWIEYGDLRNRIRERNRDGLGCAKTMLV